MLIYRSDFTENISILSTGRIHVFEWKSNPQLVWVLYIYRFAPRACYAEYNVKH